MTGLTPYLHFPGTAREALTFYAEVFGGTAEVHDFAEFGGKRARVRHEVGLPCARQC